MWKDRGRISMSAIEELDKNSNVCKKRARIPIFERIKSKFQGECALKKPLILYTEKAYRTS